MNFPIRSFVSFLFLLVSAVLLNAQTTVVMPPTVATGIYPLGTFDNQGFDTINVGNLDVYFSMPVLHKAGRGMPFTYDLSFDSSVWSIGQNASDKNIWTPVLGWGWRGVTEMATGYISGNYTTQQCFTSVPNGQGGYMQEVTGTTIYASGYVYHDQWGASHAFSGEFDVVSGTCGTNVSINTLGNSFATDGSGYEYIGGPTGTITSKNGKVYAPPFYNTTGNGTTTDGNGNEISVNSSGQFTDTTGKVALTVSGAAPSPQTFTYTDTSGNPQTVTMNYTTYTVQTAFGCSSVLEFGPTSVALVSSLTFPDGSAYEFTYEPTPGVSGAVTGRLASVELPQDGSINYTYTGSNNGIECADGSAAGLTRSVAANAGSAASTWTYTRTTGTGTSKTTVVDGLTNSKIYNFVEPSNQPTGTTAQYYETNRTLYEGAATGTPVLSRQTCYNGAAPTCTTTIPTEPFTQADTYETLNGLETHGATMTYDTYGDTTRVKTYDFASGTSRGALLQTQNFSYYLGQLVSGWTQDASGNTVSNTASTFDGTATTASSGVPQHTAPTCPCGNLTKVQLYTSATNYISLTATYEDTGSLLSVTGPAGTTTFTYDPTFVYGTGTALPTPSSGIALSTSGDTFDTTYTGLPKISYDLNSQPTTIVSYDSMLRPTEVTFPDGGQTGVTYAPTLVTTTVKQSSSATSTSETQFDAYGRPSRAEMANGRSSNPYYQSDICYDANGNLSFASYQYQSTGLTATKVCSGSGDTYAYDVLGRVLSVSRANGENIGYVYSGRATKITQSGATPVVKISQIDGLGRPTIVCEISSNGSMPGSGSPVSCGTDITPATGFITSYAYNLLNHTTTTTQGAQTRTFQTDWLGRPISVTEPESGTTTYSYAFNSTGLVVTRTKPKANQTSSSVTTTTTTQYDSLGRVTSIAYSDGTPTKTFIHDYTNGWSGYTQTNVKGQLTEASVPTAATIFSYDPMGRVAFLGECLPSGCASSVRHPLLYTYDLEGNLLTSTDGASSTGVKSTYTVSPANEVLSLTSSLSNSTNPANILSGMVNGPNGPVSYTLGNGLTGVNTFDSLGRLNGGYVCNGSSSAGCSGGTEVYGFGATWNQTQLTNSVDTVLAQTSSYTYDEFNRLASRTVTAGTANNFSWTYDRWGNRTAQTVTAGTGPAFSASFNTSTNQISTGGYAYDAAGEMTNDGFNTYTYDAEGNITAVGASGATAAYVYNALNQRVHTVVGSTTTEFLFNANGQRASVWSLSGTTSSELRGQYYWGGQPVAFYLAGGAASFQHQDWLGTERMRTTYNGAVAGSYTSLPFGDGQTVTGTDSDPYHYAVLDTDYESATDHAQFRQYNDTQGRWMMPDPYAGSYDPGNPQSFNRYAYVLNNPLAFIDPAGLNCLWDDGSEDESPDAGGDDQATCAAAGGTWVGETVVVSGNGTVVYLSDTWGWGNVGVGNAPNNNPNITVKCRGIQTYGLGNLGFQHCDAQVTDCSGVVHSLSAGPSNGALQAWDTPNPTTPFTGTTVYSEYSDKSGCSVVQGLINMTQAWNQSPIKPAYNPAAGPNSNMWLQFTFQANGISLPINIYGSIW